MSQSAHRWTTTDAALAVGAAFGVVCAGSVLLVLLLSQEWRENEHSALLDVRALASAVDSYRTRVGALPTVLTSLAPHDIREIHNDPWLTPYRYFPEDSTHYEIRSAGPDRTFLTTDDIVATGTR